MKTLHHNRKNTEPEPEHILFGSSFTHLCWLFLSPPLQPLYIIDLIHLDFEGLFQWARYRRQVHPLACGSSLHSQRGSVW